MKPRDVTRALRTMRREWDRRALENARYYVATGRQDWSDEEFFRSGETTFEQHVLNDLGNVCQGCDPGRMRVLEIGCGAGRVTRALARYFGEVHAVDVSGEMVRQARRALRGSPNAYVSRNNGKDLSVLSRSSWDFWRRRNELIFDFAFSCIVFQHIPSREIIENYVREVHRMLRPGALFKFQVQGIPLSESKADGSWIGASFSEREAREMARRSGFEMRHHMGAGDQDYWLWFFKSKDKV